MFWFDPFEPLSHFVICPKGSTCLYNVYVPQGPKRPRRSQRLLICHVKWIGTEWLESLKCQCQSHISTEFSSNIANPSSGSSVLIFSSSVTLCGQCRRPKRTGNPALRWELQPWSSPWIFTLDLHPWSSPWKLKFQTLGSRLNLATWNWPRIWFQVLRDRRGATSTTLTAIRITSSCSAHHIYCVALYFCNITIYVRPIHLDSFFDTSKSEN